jgi:hypothetical protein
LPISDWQNIKILFAMIAIFSSTCGGYISQNAFKKGTACCNFRNKLIAAAQNMWPASIDFRAFRRAAIVSLVGCWMVHCSLAEVLRWEPFMIPSPEYSGEFFPFIIITAIAYLISGYMIGRLSREIKIFLICVFTIIAQLYFANIVYEYDVSTLGQAHVASISTWWATRINFITVATLASICGVYIGQNTRRSGTGYYNFRNKMFHSPFFWWVAGSFGIFGYRGSNIYRCGMNAYGLFIEWMPILFILILLVLIVRRKKEEKFIDIFRRGLSRWGWTVLVCFLWAMYVGDYSMSPCCAPEEHCVG